jgi:hypothetical protein
MYIWIQAHSGDHEGTVFWVARPCSSERSAFPSTLKMKATYFLQLHGFKTHNAILLVLKTCSVIKINGGPSCISNDVQLVLLTVKVAAAALAVLVIVVVTVN